MISYHIRPYTWTDEELRYYSRNFKSTPCLEPERLAKCMTQFVWSPCVWADGQRAKERFREACWLVLDFDESPLTLIDSVNIFNRYCHVIGTTMNHQRSKGEKSACDRFRVALRLAEPLSDRYMFEANVRELVHKYQADKSCVDAGRLFKPCREIVSLGEGATYQAQRFERPKPQFVMKKPDWFLTQRATRFLQFGAPPSGHNQGRNAESHYFANRAFEKGWNQEDTVQAIMQACPTSGDWTESEIRNLVRKVYSKR